MGPTESKMAVPQIDSESPGHAMGDARAAPTQSTPRAVLGELLAPPNRKPSIMEAS